MNATLIKPDIYWVGAIDWAVRDFHGYMTPNGTTYNNYLILDEKITLLDTVKHDFSEIMLDNVSQLIHPSKIEYVIINHIENDHATSLDRIMAFAPNATIYITEKGKKGIARFFDISSWNIKTVKTGDVLNIGKRNLLFIETPMLHWPDSMMTYLKEDKILISQDGFGQHLATSARFDDEFIECASISELEDSVIDYYANILMPFGNIIKNKVAEIQKLGLEIEMIAPDHGIIWRRDPGKVLNMYMDMATGKSNLCVAVIYDTMWHSTEMMTLPLMRGIREEGVDCKVIKLRATPMSIAIKEFWKARGALIGTPTLNNKMFPSVAEFLQHVAGLRPKDRITGAFGSYGWGGGAVKEAYEWLRAMKLQTVEPGVEALYRPAPEDDQKCYEFGKEFARKVKEYHAQFK
ncbi:MAG TPA: FprA family A-type flavoprotein [Candidatus Sulfobium mesophilum]|nr:FprA family A-type flavoprotein [Candidatus Sulfobium mesophilum]